MTYKLSLTWVDERRKAAAAHTRIAKTTPTDISDASSLDDPLPDSLAHVCKQLGVNDTVLTEQAALMEALLKKLDALPSQLNVIRFRTE